MAFEHHIGSAFDSNLKLLESLFDQHRGKLLARFGRKNTAGVAMVNHVKALLVLAITRLLTWALTGSGDNPLDDRWMMLLSAVVSFYYGSR